MTNFRESVSARLPKFAKAILRHLRDLLNPPAIEEDVLRDYVFISDPEERPRLTFLFNSLSTEFAFGGKMTAVSIAERLTKELEKADIDVRFATHDPIDPTNSILSTNAYLRSFPTHSIMGSSGSLPMRAREILLVYNWWLSINAEPVLRAQAAHFKTARRPKIHLIQEYEAGFYDFSVPHLLAHQAMGDPTNLWAIINSRELHAFWERQGHQAKRIYGFEPRLNVALAPFLKDLVPEDKSRTILVYGRPQAARNAFFLIKSGLSAWAKKYGAGHRDWKIVSAGMEHPPVPLSNGHTIKSLGKLSLENYARLLKEASIGMSFMVSPHPSYPPLEMAHFGARVLTNNFTDKNVQDRHENLIPLASFAADDMAEVIENEIRRHEQNPGQSVNAKSRTPNFLDGEAFEFTLALAEDIQAELNS